MLARYRISEQESTVTVELTEVAGTTGELLEAFAECKDGRCSCPTNEYEKRARLDVEAHDDEITLKLELKPGTTFNTSEIAACRDDGRRD
jgi:hypothetical protein